MNSLEAQIRSDVTKGELNALRLNGNVPAIVYGGKEENVKGKTCIIVDDIIDSGGTIVNAAEALKDRGAKEVFVYITHGVLSGEAVKKIKNSVIKNLVITDTIDNSEKIKSAKNIEVLSISALMGEAIKRISNSTSVSDLFK